MKNQLKEYNEIRKEEEHEREEWELRSGNYL
jgi:hypothetical protein